MNCLSVFASTDYSNETVLCESSNDAHHISNKDLNRLDGEQLTYLQIYSTSKLSSREETLLYNFN
jgi:hypothetical protein